MLGDWDGRDDRPREERCHWRRVGRDGRRGAVPTLDQPCDLPAEGEALSQETLDSTSSYVWNRTSTAMTNDSCGAVVYVDDTNDVVRFGIFYKGKWSGQGRLPDNRSQWSPAHRHLRPFCKWLDVLWDKGRRAVGADLSGLVMAATPDGTCSLHKSGGSWEKTELELTGGSDWVGVEVSEQGKMWGYAYYPGTSAAMTAFTQEGVATAGLLTDIDGDGWSRLDEMRCGTDYTNSSSTPADADGDGVCDLFDDLEDTSVSAEPDALAIGEEFGCAVLSNSSVACWGDNSEGQLGSASAGSSSAYAVLVDLTAGFEAGAVDAGSAPACSTGLDGSLVCWGRHATGQLGRGDCHFQRAPRLREPAVWGHGLAVRCRGGPQLHDRHGLQHVLLGQRGR